MTQTFGFACDDILGISLFPIHEFLPPYSYCNSSDESDSSADARYAERAGQLYWPLTSVSRLIDQGNFVGFCSEGCFLLDPKTGAFDITERALYIRGRKP